MPSILPDIKTTTVALGIGAAFAMGFAATGAADEPTVEPHIEIRQDVVLEGPITEDDEPDEAQQAEPDEATFPWAGEELYYTVRINDAEAMRGGVRAGEVHTQGNRSYVPVSGSVRSRGFLDAAYSVDDNAVTYLDAVNSFPLRSEKSFDEAGEFRSYDVDYDHASFSADVERQRQDRESTFQSPIPEETHDMLTWLYDIRQVDDMSLGDEFSYYIYDGWLLSRLDLEVVDREDTLTPIGWFKTWKLRFTRHIKEAESNDDGDDGPTVPDLTVEEEARHTGHIWLSRDANKIPVMFTLDTPFGVGDVSIIHYTPGEPGN